MFTDFVLVNVFITTFNNYELLCKHFKIKHKKIKTVLCCFAYFNFFINIAGIDQYNVIQMEFLIILLYGMYLALFYFNSFIIVCQYILLNRKNVCV